ncbi:MAG: hypothetical protein QM647_01840 [Asticcacaulis sp.]|uniref:hypothetical protein n=1 Tax=Asticcacaulis sp. TaxID=1872648 RepID=UPI0039E52EF3
MSQISTPVLFSIFAAGVFALFIAILQIIFAEKATKKRLQEGTLLNNAEMTVDKVNQGRRRNALIVSCGWVLLFGAFVVLRLCDFFLYRQ